MRPTCIYSGVDSSSSGWTGQTWGVANRRGRHRCVPSVSGGTQRIGPLTFTVRMRIRHQVLNKQQTDRQTEGFGGLGFPRHAWPLDWKGSPREGQTDTMETECPHPETGSWARLPPTLTPLGVEGWAGPGPPRTTQLGRYGFEEMNSRSGQEGMGS